MQNTEIFRPVFKKRFMLLYSNISQYKAFQNIFQFLINPFPMIVTILAPHGVLQKLSNIAMIATITLAYRYTSFSIASNGTWWLGNLFLHYAAIYELIFELHEPHQSTEEACKDTRSKGSFQYVKL